MDIYLLLIERSNNQVQLVLKILRHIIITSGGKNLTPANIEQAIKVESPLISQIHMHADR